MILFFVFVQSIIEFFPISSSGHLILFKTLFFKNEPLDISFFTFLHLASIFATILFFRKEIKNIFISLFSKKFYSNITKNFGLLNESSYDWLIILMISSCIGTLIVGGLFELIYPKFLYTNMFFLGLYFFITAIVLLLGSFKNEPNKESYQQIYIKDAILIGIFQGFAVLPGISRSGMTIVSALFLGINRKLSFTYSFLLSIPIISLSVLFKIIQNPSLLKNYSISLFLFQIILSYIGLKMMEYLFVKKNRLIYFFYICLFSFAISWISYFFY